MKINLVGAGYWGSKVDQSLKKLGCETTIIDIKNGQTIADIDNSNPVILVTPLWQHYEQALSLLKDGYDVYVEKPMAETQEQLSVLKSNWDEQILMVGHIFIHHPQMQKIKSIDIGEIIHVSSERSNWGIYQTKTDPLLSLAVHDISIVQELIGNIKPTMARQFNYTSQTNPDRVWFSGERFDIDVSWYSPTRIRRTTILGTKGQIVWDQNQNIVTHYLNRITNNRAIAVSPTVYIYDYDKSPLEYELEHFINCVESRKEPITNINSASMVAETVDQVKNLLSK
jgi:predicted dehydrogenase